MAWITPRNEDPKPKDQDVNMKEGGTGQPAHAGQIMAKDATRPKTTQEIAADQSKVCELSQALAVQRDERERRAKVIAALDLEAKQQREARETDAQRETQRLAQIKQDENDARANRLASLNSFERLNRLRKQDGLPPLDWSSFMGDEQP